MYILRGGQDQHDYGEYVVYLKFDQEIVTTESFFGKEMSKQRIETGQGIVTCHAGKHSTPRPASQLKTVKLNCTILE